MWDISWKNNNTKLEEEKKAYTNVTNGKGFILSHLSHLNDGLLLMLLLLYFLAAFCHSLSLSLSSLLHFLEVDLMRNNLIFNDALITMVNCIFFSTGFPIFLLLPFANTISTILNRPF